LYDIASIDGVRRRAAARPFPACTTLLAGEKLRHPTQPPPLRDKQLACYNFSYRIKLGICRAAGASIAT
jgi:hypothetical protein